MNNQNKIKKEKTKKVFQVFSPDNFLISYEYAYKTQKEAQKELNKFIDRYKIQGFYSLSNRERITLSEAKNLCKIVPLFVNQTEFNEIFNN